MSDLRNDQINRLIVERRRNLQHGKKLSDLIFCPRIDLM